MSANILKTNSMERSHRIFYENAIVFGMDYVTTFAN